jgi:hypothetical protein
LVTDGLVSADGSLVPIPSPDPVNLMQRFRHKLVKALLQGNGVPVYGPINPPVQGYWAVYGRRAGALAGQSRFLPGPRQLSCLA